MAREGPLQNGNVTGNSVGVGDSDGRYRDWARFAAFGGAPKWMKGGRDVMGTRCVVGVSGGVDAGNAGTTDRRGSAAALWRVAAVLAALLPLAAPLPASAAGRVALVVGNGAYTHAGRLPNPTNDASDVAAALGRLGFEVTIARDAGRTALNEALRTFTRRSATADVALVFYAGHAMEMDGVNYLLPVDARVERDTDVRYETVTLDDVLASTSGAGLRVVILDACRNNPLARSMQRTVSTRSVSNGSLGDLNEDLLGDETLVAYSAAAGTTAADGEGRNSPYTAALLAHLEEPVDIGLMFRRVRARVLAATNRRQRPHEYGSLLREHYLSVSGGGGPAAVVAGGPVGPAGAAARGSAEADPAALVADGSSAVLAQQETVFWQSIVNSTSQADFEAYLARWPAGVYAPLAQGRLVALRAAAVRAAPVSPSVAPAPPRVESVAPDPSRISVPVVTAPPRVESVPPPVAPDPPRVESIPAPVAPAPSRVESVPPPVESAPAPVVPAPPRVESVPPPVEPAPVPVVPAPPPVEPAVADLNPATLLPGARFRDCSGCPELVVVPAGTFRMGSTTGQADERPVHEVRLDAFALGRYEVARREYWAFLVATEHESAGCSLVDGDGRLDWNSGASWRRPGFEQDDSHPAVCVSWADAQAYVNWLSEETGERYRLPSEAEWEYGARANTVTERYWDSASGPQCDYANSGDRALLERVGGWPLPVVNCVDGAARTAPVGSYEANEFGLHDALGNVWEWTADCWHDGYQGAPGDGSAWTLGGDCDRRVLRGGSWETVPSGLRSANRYRNDDNRGSALVGFRVVRALR